MSSLAEINTAQLENEALKVIVDNFPILFDQICQENEIEYFAEDFLDDFILSFLQKSTLNYQNLFKAFVFFQKIIPDEIPDSFFEKAQNLKKHRFFFKSNLFHKNDFTEAELTELDQSLTDEIKAFSGQYSFFFHNLKSASEYLKELSFFPQTDDIKLFRREAEKKFNALIYKEQKLTIAYEHLLLMSKEVEAEIIRVRQEKIQKIFIEERSSFFVAYRQELSDLEKTTSLLQTQSPNFLKLYANILVSLIRFFPKYLQLVDLLSSLSAEKELLADLEKNSRLLFEKLYPKKVLLNRPGANSQLFNELKTRLTPAELAIIERFLAV